MAYSFDLIDLYQRVANPIDAILEEQSPATCRLPVDQIIVPSTSDLPAAGAYHTSYARRDCR